MRNSLFIALILGLTINSALCDPPIPDDDLVRKLVNVTDNANPNNLIYSKEWYSGILHISKTQSIQYWFFPSQRDKTKDPVVLWLNGGPGCSSFLGATQEHGPFLFNTQDGEEMFIKNNFSWNLEANVIYFESPPGVGFSLAQPDYKYTDAGVTQSAYDALLLFFKGYTDYQKNQFYISGQSYAGIYVPYLATQVLTENAKNLENFKINLKGILVGNACTLTSECGDRYEPKFYEYIYKRGFISKYLAHDIKVECSKDAQAQTCLDLLQKADKSFANVNYYDTNSRCQINPSSRKRSSGQKRILNLSLNRECVLDAVAQQYFNQDQVQQQLHTPQKKEWRICNDTISGNDTFKALYQPENGTYWLYPNLIQNKLRIWIYSGDIDAAVPITGTTAWFTQIKEDLDLPDLIPWTSWLYFSSESSKLQNGGQFWSLDGITFVSIRGSGHMVPETNPQASHHILRQFLTGEPLVIPNADINL